MWACRAAVPWLCKNTRARCHSEWTEWGRGMFYENAFVSECVFMYTARAPCTYISYAIKMPFNLAKRVEWFDVDEQNLGHSSKFVPNMDGRMDSMTTMTVRNSPLPTTDETIRLALMHFYTEHTEFCTQINGRVLLGVDFECVEMCIQLTRYGGEL